MAPYIAMLRTDEVWTRYQKIILVHGVRYEHELAYREELAGHAQVHADRFRYVPVVSRQSPPNSLSGRITHCLTDGRLESAAGCSFHPERSTVFLCGNPDMLTEMEHELATGRWCVINQSRLAKWFWSGIGSPRGGLVGAVAG